MELSGRRKITLTALVDGGSSRSSSSSTESCTPNRVPGALILEGVVRFAGLLVAGWFSAALPDSLTALVVKRCLVSRAGRNPKPV